MAPPERAMTDTRSWQLLVLVLILGGLVWLLAPVLTPFAIAALLAWLGDPLVARLERRGLSRGLSVTVVFAAMTVAAVLAVIALVPLLEGQIAKLIEKLPQVVAWANGVILPWVEANLGVGLDRLEPGSLIEMLKAHWQEAGGIASTLIRHATTSGLAIVGFLGMLALLPVITFYFLRDWDRMVGQVRELLPRHVEPTVSRLAREADQVLAAFLRGQLAVMVLLGVIYSVGLWLVGLDLAFLIGMLAGLVSFVPYLGVIIGGGAALIAAAVQFQDFVHPLLVLGVFTIGQLIESFILTPTIVGDRVGLHPVAVIFAILAGGALFGFLGVLLALPVAAVGMVLLREAHRHYLESALYGAAADPGTAPAPAADAAPSSVPDARTQGPGAGAPTGGEPESSPPR
jgi:predicted PurR-regulated permease PerM